MREARPTLFFPCGKIILGTMRKTVITLLFILSVVGVQARQSLGAGELSATLRRASDLFERGRWSDARQALLDVRPQLTTGADRERVDYQLAVCRMELGGRDADAALLRFRELHPGSAYANDVRLALASYYCTAEDYARAREELDRIDYRALKAADRERFDVRQGYIAFVGGDYDEAVRYFSRIAPDGPYGDHALYYRSYIAYSRGDDASAQAGFVRLVRSDAYGALAPFYLLQIRFRQGDYAYVVDKAPELIRTAATHRRADLFRVVAEAWFRLDDYPKAVAALKDFRTAEGRMGRDEYYIEGYALYRMARYDEAAASLRKACGADDPLTQNASYHLADCYLRAGDKPSAMQAFAMAADGAYDERIAEEALFNYGKLQWELGGGRFNEAIHVLGRYVERYPASERTPEARTLLAAAYYNAKDYDAAYEAIRRLPDPDGEMRAALQKVSYFRGLEAYDRGDLETARRSLAEAASVGVSPKFSSLAAFWQGEIAYAKGDWEAARRQYESYLKRAPRSEREYALAIYNLGYCDFSQRRMADAATRFERFLSLYAPQDDYRADALCRLGDARYALRLFDGAVEAYDEAIATDRTAKYHALYRRALTLGILGRTQEKIDALRSMVASGRGDRLADASYELGRTYLAAERYDEGARALERFVADYPHASKHTAALTDLGLAYFNLGQRDKALAYYDRVVRGAPNSPEARDAMQAIREIYVGGGDADAYFAYAERTGAENDLSAVARDSLSFAAAQKLYLADRTDAASRSLRSYLKSFPKGYYRTDALYYLSDCYLRAGSRGEAISALRELVDEGQTQYRVDALGKLAAMTEAEGRTSESAAAYRKLIDEAPTAAARAEAADGYLRTTVAAGDDEAILKAASEAESLGAGDSSLRRVRFAAAKVCEKRGDQARAMELYERLSAEVRSPEGAEAMYRRIEAARSGGESERAERMILDFSDRNTPQSYWLAKAFLLLGDIYLERGDDFQARATYQSVADGYSPSDDGIVAAARERIAKMKRQ